MREGEKEEGEEKKKKKKKKGAKQNNVRAPCPHLAEFKRDEREIVALFVWSKIKDTKHKGPTSIGQFAQCFKYIGTIIPRYTIIK